MSSSQLLNRTLANRLLCESQQISIGPTGPAGPSGANVPIPGALKAFTIYLDYTAANALSRVYIPPGLFSSANPTLAAGGVFTANQGADLIFLGGTVITMNNTAYAFVSGINASGYIAPGWQNIAGARLNSGASGVYFSAANDYGVQLNGLNLSNINGGAPGSRAPTGTAAGFSATVTIFYV